MVRQVILTTVLLSIFPSASNAQATPLDEYIKLFSGRWVCDTKADQDVEGYMKKGESIRMVIVSTPMDDRSGLRREWHLEKDGIVRGRSHGITTWDAARKTFKHYAMATGGFHVEDTFIKQGNKWHSSAVVTFPDGSKATSKAVESFSKDGDTRTVMVSNRISHDGKELADLKNTWKRVKPPEITEDESKAWLKFFVGSWKREREMWIGDEKAVDTATWNCELAADGNATVSKGKWDGDGAKWVTISGWGAGKVHFERGTNSSGASWSVDFNEMDGKTLRGTLAGVVEGKKAEGAITLTRTGEDSYMVTWEVKFTDGAVHRAKITNTRA